MSDAPLQLIALALFAELNARIDAGEPRHVVLTEKGLSEEEFRCEQQRWLQLLASQAEQQQWQLQQRYSAAYSQWRLRNRPHDPPPLPSQVDTMPGIASPLLQHDLSLGASPGLAATGPALARSTHDDESAETAFAYRQSHERLPLTTEPYSPKPYDTQPYAPKPYAAEPYAPRPYAAEPYAPKPYAAEPHAPQPYAAEPYAPQHYTPEPYAQSAASAVAHAPAFVSPAPAPAAPGVTQAALQSPPIDLNATAFPGTVVLPAVAFAGSASTDEPLAVAKPPAAAYSNHAQHSAPAETYGASAGPPRALMQRDAFQPEPHDSPPQYPEPQYAEPQYAEPQYAEPQYAEPQYAEPQYSEPQYSEPQYAEPQYAQHEQPERPSPAQPVFVSPRANAPSPRSPQQPLFVSPKPGHTPYSPQTASPPASPAGPPYFSSPNVTRAESFAPNPAPSFAASGYFVTGSAPQPRPSPAAPPPPTGWSALPLSFEQLTCLSVEIEANPSEAATALAGYGIDRPGYEAQLQALRVRCEADQELAQRHERLLQYYRAVVTKR